MKRWIFPIGYWLAHTSGVLPVALKHPKKKASVSSLGQGTSRATWTSSKRAVLIGLGQLSLVLYDIYEWFTRINGIRDHTNLQILISYAIATMDSVAAFCFFLTSLIHRREVERLLNSVCSLCISVFKCIDPPKAGRFAYIIAYSIASSAMITSYTIFYVILGSAESQIQISSRMFHQWTFLFMDVILGTICVYLQSAVRELNRKIKLKFPTVDEWDWKYWESATCGEENNPQEGPRSDVKSVLEEYRLTYRTVADIIDRMNSAYGCIKLILVVHNQAMCLVMAYGLISVFLRSQVETLDAVGWLSMILRGFSCVRRFVRISVICHSFGMVIKELEVTARYIATIDASEIDLGSKIELLGFIEEIDGRKIRFMASHIFSLDHATLYTLLTGTATYIIVIVQYLS